jgi:hypothetical protein
VKRPSRRKWGVSNTDWQSGVALSESRNAAPKREQGKHCCEEEETLALAVCIC